MSDPEPQPDLPPPPATPRPARGGAPWSVVVIALAFGLLCLGAAAAVVAAERSGPQDAELRRSALDAARERTTALTSYDHRTLEADIAGVLATATGGFVQEYTETVNGLRDAFVRTQAVATSTVLAVGLEGEVERTERGQRAVAVVAVDQVIRTAGAEPRTERNRLRMELLRPDDTWLVADVERL